MLSRKSFSNWPTVQKGCQKFPGDDLLHNLSDNYIV
jgi:hypothetical protein